MSDFSVEELKAELEHLEFLDEMRKLVEEIAWALASVPFDTTNGMWFDVKVYGNEPVFASLIFDRLTEEYNRNV